jgi:hypothetical protein
MWWTQPGTLPSLEVRLGLHFPTHLHLKDGNKLNEPPAIEGYLDRIRPNTQIHHAVYVSTHDGYIVCSTPAHANPPPPPSVRHALQGNASAAGSGAGELTLREREVRRGARQMLESDGIIDMRSVLVVRRAFQSSAHRREDPQSEVRAAQKNQATKPWEEDESFGDAVERTASDDEDEGGEQGLTNVSAAGGKTALKMRRSFELVLKTGQIVRYEVSDP